MNTKLSFLLDLVIFQIAWFLCVLATKTPFPEISPLLGLALVMGRALQAARFRNSLPFFFASLAIGITGDAILVQTDLLKFPPYPHLFGSPLWMILLWACFGLMLRPVFTWFLDHCLRSILGFSMGGVVAYWSGQKLGVLEFGDTWILSLIHI